MDDSTHEEPLDQITAADPTELKKERSFLRELPVLILLAFTLAVVVKTFFLQAFFIPSASMEPTLQIQDRVLVNKVIYRLRDPKRGEIIVFIAKRGKERSFPQRVRAVLFEGLGVTKPSETDFVKRVIGLPGETVEVTEGEVFVTPVAGARVKLDEPYIDPAGDTSSFGPFVVPARTYFVMGDNRANSADSRSALGPIRREDIVGKAFIRIWPPKRTGFFRRPSYKTSQAQAVSSCSWSPTGRSSDSCTTRGSAWLRASMKPAVERSLDP